MKDDPEENKEPAGADTGLNPDSEISDDDGGSTPEPSNTDAAAETSIDHDADSAEVERQYKLVPPIGTGWRWYEIPYRLFYWLLSGSRRRFVPWHLRLRLNNGLNYFNVFEQYDRMKMERRNGPLDNLIVPADEEVTQGAIWVVEFFPPSHYDSLLRSLKKNGWRENNFMGSMGASNAERIARARRGSGLQWSRLGSVVNPNSGSWVMDAKREVLPPEFDRVELTGTQIGSSMTAVVAFIRLSKKGQSSLNEVWKAEHEPILEFRGLRRPNAESRYFSGIRATQRERQRLHDIARSWLSERCGGFFAKTDARQPVIDFNMFKQYDPTTTTVNKAMGGPLRALAMVPDAFYNYVSPQIRGAVLSRGDPLPDSRGTLENCWGVVGSYQVFSEANENSGYGQKPYSVDTLAAMVDDYVRAFLLHYAVLHYARLLNEQAATQRDTARSKHRNFSPSQLDALKRELLTFSVDLPAVARDTAQLWSPRWRAFEGLDVRGVPRPGTSNSREELDVIEDFGNSRTELFERLLADDAAYREVLATTSSLGANAATIRVARRTLLVAMVTLFVSAITLGANGSALWKQITEWLSVFG